MKKILIPALCLMLASGVYAGQKLAGVPMMHNATQLKMQCSSCHANTQKFTRPESAKCTACHGPMQKIKVAPNKENKNPHDSAHYADTIECTACHAEHKPGKVVCASCHKVNFKKFK